MFLLCKHVRLTCGFNKLMMMMMMIHAETAAKEPQICDRKQHQSIAGQRRFTLRITSVVFH